MVDDLEGSESKNEEGESKSKQSLEREDFYFNEDGLMVFTEKFLLKRGFCCESGCKHCPYGFNDN